MWIIDILLTVRNDTKKRLKNLWRKSTNFLQWNLWNCNMKSVYSNKKFVGNVLAVWDFVLDFVLDFEAMSYMLISLLLTGFIMYYSLMFSPTKKIQKVRSFWFEILYTEKMKQKKRFFPPRLPVWYNTSCGLSAEALEYVDCFSAEVG